MNYNILKATPPMADSHRYSTEKGKISLVHPCSYTDETYEIHCIRGALFDDIERYDTFDEAMERITELLT